MALSTLTGTALGTSVLVTGQPGAAGGPGGPPAPNVGTGWELGVLDAASQYQTLLCKVPPRAWTSFTVAPLINDQGSATVILNLDDPFWTSTTLAGGGLAPHYILDEEHCWRVFQDGVGRFDFMGETVTEQLVDASEQRMATVTGPGSLVTLSWAMAAPPGFPDTIVYKTDALADDFSEVDGTGAYVIDYGLWNNSSNKTSISVNPAGSAQLVGTTGGTVLGTTEWDFTNTLLSAQVTPIMSPDLNNVTLNGSELTQLYVESLTGGYYVMLALSSTSFYAQYNGPDGLQTHVICTAADYAQGMTATYEFEYWQVSEASGTFYFWTSTDGQTWVKQWQVARGWDSTQCGIFFAAQYTGTTPVEYATVSSINSDVAASSLGGATYLDQPIMSAYAQTLAAAKARNTIPFVTTTMTSAHDSYNNPWTDSQSVQIQNGTNLYDLLQAHCSMIDADYYMQPGFKLVVGLPAASEPNPGQVTLGYDRSATVRFYDGANITVKSRQRQRNQIQNLIAVINSDSVTVTTSDPSSISTWGQREAWVQAAMQVTTADLDIVASAAAQQLADEVLSYTLQIQPNVAGKTIFKDFQPGDWVGLERPDFSAVDAVRVIGISVSVDASGNETHELTLQTYVQFLEQRLQYIATKMGGGFVSANGTTAIADNAQGSTLQAPTVFSGSLTSLGIPTSTGGAPLVYNPVTGKWVAAASVDPDTGSEVGVQLSTPGGTVLLNSQGVTAAVTPSQIVPLNANPAFNVAGVGSTSGWQGVNSSIAAVTPSAGLPSQASAVRVTPSTNGLALVQASSANAAVQGGSQYTLYAYAFLPTQANMGVTTEITWKDAQGNTIQTDALSTVIPASQWVLLAYQDQAPAGAVSAQAAVGQTSGVTTVSAQYANVQLVPGAATGGTDASSTSVTPTGTQVIDATGTVRITTGLQSDGTVTTTYAGGAAGAAPDTPTVTGTMLGLNVTWDGLLGGAVPLSDFLYVKVHVSTVSGFTPSAANLYTVMASSGTAVIGQLTGGTTYFVKLVAVNESGNSSSASTQASATTQTVPSNIPSGGITSIMLATGVAGAHVTIGTAPSSPATGDLWYDSANGFKLNQWNGTSWQPFQYGTNAIAANSVTASLIAANTITAAQIASATITSLQIAANTITASNIVSGTITATQIAGTTITAAQIASATITTTQIAAGTITASNIHAATITGSVIAATTITGSNIAAATITATNIAANTITASLIAAGTITATQIASGTITGTQIAASVSLSAPVITGGSVTGASIVADGSNGEFLVYAGSPTSGNLIGSWSALSGSDGLGNSFKPGAWVYDASGNAIGLVAGTGGTASYLALSAGSATPSPLSGVAAVYGNSTGGVNLVDEGDGVTYSVGQRIINLGGGSTQTINTTGFSNFGQSAVTVRTYKVYARLIATGGGGTAAIQWNGPAGNGLLHFVSQTGATLNEQGVKGMASQISPNLASGTIYIIVIEGLCSFTSAGTFFLQGAAPTGATWTVDAWSYLEVKAV